MERGQPRQRRRLRAARPSTARRPSSRPSTTSPCARPATAARSSASTSSTDRTSSRRSPTSAFQHYARAHLPTIWGLHNYSDTNRYRSTGTKAVLAAVKGQVWLTETGGLVQFGGAFPYSLSRASKALTYMFKLAASNRRIARLYIYNWYGGDASTRFDAGLVDLNGMPRPGYFAVLKKLTGR